MISKLLPVIFLLLGVGAGIGAGISLVPGSTSQANEHAAKETPSAGVGIHDVDTHRAGASETEYIRINNQFVIPVIQGERVSSLVVVSLSLEIQNGISDEIYAREPKLRDGFLRVMFDHANMGGFHGAFTSAERLDLLRSALRDVAQKELGPDVLDVLILDIVRQDT